MFCHVPPLQLSAETIGCVVVGRGCKIPRNGAGLLAGKLLRYRAACAIDLPHELPLLPTAASSAVSCYMA